MPRGADEASPRARGGADAPGFCQCARSIENFRRIKMSAARASGMDLASSLRQNTFLTLEVRPVGPHRPTTLKITATLKLKLR